MTKDAWKAKTVRNYIFRTINSKAAMVLNARPSIHAESDDGSATSDELRIAEIAVKSELKRMSWQKFRRRAFVNGAICGKAILHLYNEEDPLTGESKLRLEVMDPVRCAPDPSALSVEECEYFCIYPDWDLSRIRRTFPDKGQFVKPSTSTKIADSNLRINERLRTEEEMIYGPSRELALGKDGVLSEKKAQVVLVWIKDPLVVYNTRIDDQGDAKKDAQRQFPFGRLIAYAQNIKLYDGPNPYSLEEVFPFYDYVHYDDPVRFWGYGDVAHLKSIQMMMDKNAAMILDAQRLTSMGVFEYPIGADGFDAAGTTPGQRVPVPPELCGQARWIVPAGYNVQLHTVLDEMGQRDMQRVSGISDVSAGVAPNAPTSGVEVEARQRAAATQMGTHLDYMVACDSALANGVFQLMKQLYTAPRTFIGGEPGNPQSVTATIADLPPGIKIRVDADPDEIEKDRLAGQNIAGFVTGGAWKDPAVAATLDLLLPELGVPRQKAVEWQKRLQQVVQQMGSQPPSPPPPAPDRVLVAISDILKVQPAYVSFDQVQQALSMCGVQPETHPDVLHPGIHQAGEEQMQQPMQPDQGAGPPQQGPPAMGVNQ